MALSQVKLKTEHRTNSTELVTDVKTSQYTSILNSGVVV